MTRLLYSLASSILRAKLVLPIVVAILAANASAADNDQGLPSFDILEYEIHGNTRLSDIDIERAVTPFLGLKKTLNDVESARAALERVRSEEHTSELQSH